MRDSSSRTNHTFIYNHKYTPFFQLLLRRRRSSSISIRCLPKHVHDGAFVGRRLLLLRFGCGFRSTATAATAVAWREWRALRPRRRYWYGFGGCFAGGCGVSLCFIDVLIGSGVGRNSLLLYNTQRKGLHASIFNKQFRNLNEINNIYLAKERQDRFRCAHHIGHLSSIHFSLSFDKNSFLRHRGCKRDTSCQQLGVSYIKSSTIYTFLVNAPRMSCSWAKWFDTAPTTIGDSDRPTNRSPSSNSMRTT